MDILEIFSGQVKVISRIDRAEEVYFTVALPDFRKACLFLHKELSAPVALMFASDDRKESGTFGLTCGFRADSLRAWVFVSAAVDSAACRFESLSHTIHSASLFEREIKEMFGIEPEGAPDTRSLRLHDEIWPKGYYPLRKDFKMPPPGNDGRPVYQFVRGEGEGVFEVPVGPVHAGIIGPGHFRFSCAGEPIINLETRLGFTHRGIEKLFEGRGAESARLAECVSGDSSFSHSLAFCRALEKISGIEPPEKARQLRALFLELERMYNHANDIGGIALDVGFSFPAALASLIKETIQQANERLTGSRFLKGVNVPGGVLKDIDDEGKKYLAGALDSAQKDFRLLRSILRESVSFMDRVEATGVLKRKTAQDLGVTGLCARACGLRQDLRKDFEGKFYGQAGFKMACEQSGDVLARLNVRFFEFEESLRLVRLLMDGLPDGKLAAEFYPKPGFALGCAEGWRGPVLYWIKTGVAGAIERCKIVDPSFLDWQGLAFCVLGDIIPDFPLCNKSFDISYSGHDL